MLVREEEVVRVIEEEVVRVIEEEVVRVIEEEMVLVMEVEMVLLVEVMPRQCGGGSGGGCLPTHPAVRMPHRWKKGSMGRVYSCGEQGAGWCRPRISGQFTRRPEVGGRVWQGRRSRGEGVSPSGVATPAASLRCSRAWGRWSWGSG